MAIQITTLAENTQGEHTSLIAEHGLSFLIETKDASILFDTGQSNSFLHNAKHLQKDLSLVEHVVLSHGHYDHSGGFPSFVESGYADNATLYVGEGFFTPKYAKYNASYQFLGNSFGQAYISEHQIPHKIITESTEITPSVWVVTNFLRTHSEEVIDSRFVLKSGDGFERDQFVDEVLLVVKSALGLVVLVGCSHPGILNMLDTVRNTFREPIYALLGGTHLVEADRKRTINTLNQCKEDGISVMGISHCSGSEAIALAIADLTVHFHNTVGSTLILEE